MLYRTTTSNGGGGAGSSRLSYMTNDGNVNEQVPSKRDIKQYQAKFLGMADLPEGEVALNFRRDNNKELLLQELDDLAKLALDCLRINNAGD